ncbi:TPA: hypothetical protein ACH3X3_001036 [Trebouxia sp. C0006]
MQGPMHGTIQSLYDSCLLSVTPVALLMRAGCQVQACRSSSCPCELVYADDICLVESSTYHLQALLNALALCCALLHTKICISKTKVMVVFSVVQTCHCFTCNGCDIQEGGYKLTPLAKLLIFLYVPRQQTLERWCSKGMPSCSAMTQSIQIDALPKPPHSCYTSW